MAANRILLTAVIAAASLVSIAGAQAQRYPTRPVTLISPFAAGGGTDVLCRIMAEKLREVLGQQFIVENRTAGGGIIGAEAVARAAPDGHVLLCAPDPVYFSQLLYSKLSFDPRAFEPVSVFAKFSFALVARVGLPASNLSELIAYARANPGKLNWASPGIGQTAHLILEALKTRTDVDIVHIPYRGGGPALNDLLAGQVDLTAATLTIGAPQIAAGKVKLLGITSHTRLEAFPKAATLAETVPGLDADALVAIAAPPGTSKEITHKLSEAIAKVLAMPDVKVSFSQLQTESFGTTPEQMGIMIRAVTRQWAPVIAAANISLD
jgi:tripartite-type tricarboxylate transporter receptor subunit TctC